MMHKYNYDSLYKEYSGQSLNWLPSDTAQHYKRNLEEKFQALESNGWSNSTFQYTFNSHGFRCEEFTDDPTIMFLGCSNTVGIGLPIESVWATLVAKELNMRPANLGIGGGSSDCAFRLCHGWIDIIKPKIVIFVEPPGFRLEIVNSTSHLNTLSGYSTEHLKFIIEWNSCNDNNYFNSQKNQLAIKAMCDARNIKYFYFHSDDFNIYKIDFARDLAHYGPKTHKRFADHVIGQISL